MENNTYCQRINESPGSCNGCVNYECGNNCKIKPLIPVTIYRFKRDKRTSWLLVLNKEYNIAIIQIQSHDLFRIPDNVNNRYFLIKNGDYYDLEYIDKHGYRNTIEAINRKTLTGKQRGIFRKYLSEIVELV